MGTDAKDAFAIHESLVDTGGTVDRLAAVELLLDGISARQEAEGSADSNLARAAVLASLSVQRCIEDVRRAADLIGELRA